MIWTHPIREMSHLIYTIFVIFDQIKQVDLFLDNFNAVDAYTLPILWCEIRLCDFDCDQSIWSLTWTMSHLSFIIYQPSFLSHLIKSEYGTYMMVNNNQFSHALRHITSHFPTSGFLACRDTPSLSLATSPLPYHYHQDQNFPYPRQSQPSMRQIPKSQTSTPKIASPQTQSPSTSHVVSTPRMWSRTQSTCKNINWNAPYKLASHNHHIVENVANQDSKQLYNSNSNILSIAINVNRNF